MINWINSKISIDNPDVPKFNTEQISTLSGLQSGLVLIKLTNQIISEILEVETHPLHNSRLYYLNPIYTKPTFKLQRIENLNEYLQFARLILNINVLFISSENIIDGNAKLVLGFIWLLFLLSNLSGVSSFVELKSILGEWLNVIEIKGFIWELPIRTLSTILTHYGEHEIEESDTKAFLQHVKSTYNIPILISPQDFNDEKCVVTYLVEWYKFFALGSFKSSKYNTLIELVVSTVRLKNRFETCALRFINRCNSYLGSRNETLLGELTSKDYPQLREYYNSIASNVDTVGIYYYPSIKALNFDNLTNKLNEVLQKSGDTSKQVKPSEASNLTSSNLPSKSDFNSFLKILEKMPQELNHYELHKILKSQLVTLDLPASTLDSFMKLIPKKVSSPTMDHDFKLSSSSSYSSFEDDRDFIFDDVQQKLDSQLSGTFDKVYDLSGFVGGLVGGFHV